MATIVTVHVISDALMTDGLPRDNGRHSASAVCTTLICTITGLTLPDGHAEGTRQKVMA